MTSFPVRLSLFQFTHPGRGATFSRLRSLRRKRSFNSRTPGGVRPQRTRYVYASADVFQFTHPGRGATRPRLFGRGRHPCFNSRTPGGVRHRRGGQGRREQGVSIHAPREGCDSLKISTSYPRSQFQFTHPGRGATSVADIRTYQCKFQFTHPGRGATTEEIERGDTRIVSIHAPREGCDYALRGRTHRKGCFNSRTPGGVRLIRVERGHTVVKFQFTHPGRGAT